MKGEIVKLTREQYAKIAIRTRAACGLPPHFTEEEVASLQELMSLTNWNESEDE